MTDKAHSEENDLRSVGLKATLPRLKILDIFRKIEQRHMTAEDVYRHLMSEHSDIGLATVYRVLSQFETAGILVRSQFDNGKAVYELNDGEHHDHLICTVCNKVVEFHDTEIEKTQEKIAKRSGFVLSDHEMVLYGVCKDCQKK